MTSGVSDATTASSGAGVSEAIASGSKTTPRSMALDVFRGITVALMLLVNNVALDTATPEQLWHAPWGAGIRLADLVFPWFLFATGLSIPYAFASLHRHKPGYLAWAWKALHRAFWLFALGCLVTSAVDQRLEISLGVLQLIGLAFLVAALLHPLAIGWRVLIAVILLLGYWAALRFLAVPGVPAGLFEEHQNLVRFVNNTYLEPIGLRGFPSLIPTAALVLIAAWVGELTRRSGPVRLKVIWLIAVGLLLAAMGFLWDLDLEINKSVWTPSYILVSAGLGTVLLGALTWLETLRWRSWGFVFVVFGSNALLGYIAPILVKVWLLQGIQVRPGLTLLGFWLGWLKTSTNPITGGWLYTFIYLALTWLFLLVLYRKKLFLRV